MNPAVEEVGATLVDDVAVPRARLVDLLDGMDRIAAEHDVAHRLPRAHRRRQHAPAPSSSTAATPRRRRGPQTAFDAIMRLALELGGTITGEHGVGLLKREWLRTELGEPPTGCSSGSSRPSTRSASSTPARCSDVSLSAAQADQQTEQEQTLRQIEQRVLWLATAIVRPRQPASGPTPSG